MVRKTALAAHEIDPSAVGPLAAVMPQCPPRHQTAIRGDLLTFGPQAGAPSCGRWPEQ